MSNRSPDDSLSLDIDLQGLGSSRVIEHQLRSHTDPRAANTADRPDEIAAVDGEGLVCDRGARPAGSIS